MVLEILLFELRQRLARLSTGIYFLVLGALSLLFMLASGGAFASVSVDFGTGGKVLVNSPYALMEIIGYISIFGVVITAALAGQATCQDASSTSTSLLYSMPITKFEYLTGRFLGALAAQLVIFPSVGLGAWLAVRTHLLDATRVGPNHLAAFLLPYLILALPNILITTALFFAIAALGRRMLPVYIASVLLLIGYFVAGQLSSGIHVTRTAALLDPFGATAVDYLTQYWTPFERNTHLIPFSGMLLLNRLLWLGASAAILAVTFWRFSFRLPGTRSGRAALTAAPGAGEPPLPAMAFPRVNPEYSLRGNFATLFSLVRLHFSETVKNIFFGVLLLAGGIFSFLTASGLLTPRGIHLYPVTYRMVEMAGGGFFLFALAIITFYSGELVWRERDAGLAQIVDALPVPRWVLFGAKLGALLLLPVLLMAVVTASGVLVQLLAGYHHFEWSVYFRELFLIRLIGFWMLCVLALFLHTLINQKYLAHFAMVLYFIALIALRPLGFENHLYLFGVIPPYIYSDMNGFGPFVKAIFWFSLYWSLAAAALAILTSLLWVRGTPDGGRTGWKQARGRLATASRTGLGVILLAFAATGAFIYYNTSVQNVYRSTFRNDEDRAQYEKKYRAAYAALPQPRLTRLSVQVDLEPRRRLAQVNGQMWLENKTDAPIDRVALTVWPEDLAPLPRPPVRIQQLSFAGGQAPVLEDPALGFYVFRLSHPLAPGAGIELDFRLRYPNPGFVNSRPNTDIVDNGSFLNNSYVPFIGYFQDVELTDDSIRHRHGLDKVKRLAALGDAAALQDNYVSTDSDWIHFDGTISTSPDQLAILPGYLQSEWRQNGRRYFHYSMDSPMLGIFSANSARYALLHDHWHDVSLEIYYHPAHTFDLNRMMRSMKATLDYCTAAFSPYQFRQLRILEFPRYGTYAESFPNTIPYSEAIGFIEKVDPQKPDSIDLPFYVTAHEVGHQWWGHQVVSANVEGATSIVETLAQYTALMVMQHTYGRENMKKFLRFELDGYLRGRAQERNQERPLYRVEPLQGYIHYNKGGLVMYALQDYIGEDAVNRGLSNFVKAYAFKGPPYSTSLDMISFLKKETPPQFLYLYDDLFEHITLYHLRARSAAATKLPGGLYQVHLTLEAAKSRVDSHGQEQPVPIHDWMDVGVLGRDGKYLYLKKHLFTQPVTDLTLTVQGTPQSAGIDPLDILIDRDPDEHVATVRLR